MKQLRTFIATVLDCLFFSLFESTGFLYRAGMAVSFGLYCQFENPLDLNGLLYHILTVPSLDRMLPLLSFYSNSAVQTLEILFLFSSMILIMYQIRKIINAPSCKVC